MITPKGFTPNPTNDVDNRIMRAESTRRDTSEILDLLHRYGDAVLNMTNLEQQIATRLKVWYTDYSIYSPLIIRLKEIIDNKTGMFQKEATQLIGIAEEQKAAEDVTYKSLRASVNNYHDRAKTYEHYRRKLPKLKSGSEKDIHENKVRTRNIERLQRNERKLENSMVDTDVYGQQIISETNRLNLERFDKMNILIRLFIDMQLKDAFKLQEQYIDIENYEQVFDNVESDFFNQRFFETKENAPIRVTEHTEEINKVKTIVESQKFAPEKHVLVESVDLRPVREVHEVIKQEVDIPPREEFKVSRIEERGMQDETRLRFSRPPVKDVERYDTMEGHS